MSWTAVGPALVAFDHPLLGSATGEFEDLGDDAFILFLKPLNAVSSGRLDHRRLKEFDNDRGVPFYKAEIDDMVVVYAVEEDAAGDRKVTVMFAGRRGRPFSWGPLEWDGANDDALRDNVVRPRAAVWFH